MRTDPVEAGEQGDVGPFERPSPPHEGNPSARDAFSDSVHSFAVGTSFRRATRNDAPAIARLVGELGYPAKPPELAARLTALLDAEAYAVLVAEDDGATIGWLHVLEQVSLVSPPCALIAGLIVAEERHGSGVGRGLVERAEAWAIGRVFGVVFALACSFTRSLRG